MRTDDLVHALAADHHAVQSSIGRRFMLAIAVGFAISAAAFWVTLGFRPDIATAAFTVRFDLKIVQALLLAASAASLVLRLARPGADTRPWIVVMLAAPTLLVIAVVAELVLIPTDRWQANLIGSFFRMPFCDPAAVAAPSRRRDAGVAPRRADAAGPGWRCGRACRRRACRRAVRDAMH